MAAEGCSAWQLKDVQRWLREQEGCPAWQLKDVQRIREAVALLSPPDVQALQDVQFLPSQSVVQALQTKWKVDLAALVLVSQATLLPISKEKRSGVLLPLHGGRSSGGRGNSGSC